MKKLLSMFATVSLIGTTSASCIGCREPEPSNLGVAKIDLHNIIEKTKIGNINVGLKDTICKEILLAAIKANNDKTSNLRITDFEIKTVEEQSILIAGVGEYEGEVELNYQTSVFKKISDGDDIKGKVLTSTTDKDGNLYVATDKGNLYQSQRDGSFKLFINLKPEVVGNIQSLAMTTNGICYFSTYDGNNTRFYRTNTDGGFQLVDGWNDVRNIANLVADKAGNIYVILWGAYFTSTHNFKGALYKIEADGSFQSVYDGNISNLVISGNGTLYFFNSDNELYKKKPMIVLLN